MNNNDCKITLQDEGIKMDATIIKDDEGAWFVDNVDGSKVKFKSIYCDESILTNSIQVPKNKFEKVSWKQFRTDVENTIFPYLQKFCGYTYDDFEDGGKISKAYDAITLPRRATKYSAGYDFFSPFLDIPLYAGESVIIPTGIKMELMPGCFLAVYPRSSYGFKYKMRLDNTVGIIDKDYYNNPNNEGHIMIKVCCEKEPPKFNLFDLGIDLGRPIVQIGENSKFAQGIIMGYGITCDDSPCDNERSGGIGSTGK